MTYRTIYTLVCFLLLIVANIQADNLTQPVSLVPVSYTHLTLPTKA